MGNTREILEDLKAINLGNLMYGDSEQKKFWYYTEMKTQIEALEKELKHEENKV